MQVKDGLHLNGWCACLFFQNVLFSKTILQMFLQKSFINALVSQPSGTNPYAMWDKVSVDVYNSCTICGKEVQEGEIKM